MLIHSMILFPCLMQEMFISSGGAISQELDFLNTLKHNAKDIYFNGFTMVLDDVALHQEMVLGIFIEG